MAGPDTLPINLDTTYADDASDPSRKLHQQYHDLGHLYLRKLDDTILSGGVIGSPLVKLSIGTYGPGDRIVIDGTVRAALLATNSNTEHAVTVYQKGTAGADIGALNIVSDNPAGSAGQLRGKETNRGTLKITHEGYVDGSDANAAGISIDLTVAGTSAQGIFVTGTTGPTTGNLLTLRNNARDDFVVKATGRTGIGLPTGTTPAGMLEIRQPSTSDVGLAMTAIAAGQQMILLKDSGGNARFEVNASGNAVIRATMLVASGISVQIGSTTADLGGGTGVISIKNRGTAPTTNPTGGGILYADNGTLMWRSDLGNVRTVAAA